MGFGATPHTVSLKCKKGQIPMNLLIRGIYALLISFVISVLVYPKLIPALHKFKFGQTVRDDGPEAHLKKNGTPTMGGISFLCSFVIAALVLKPTHEVIAVMLVTLGFGVIGFIDDYIKIAKHRSLGLRPMQKIVGQLVICVVFVAYLYKTVGTSIYIPFAGGKMWNLGWLYIPFVIVAVLGTVNGVNLTDGLDGLSSGVTIIVIVFFTMCAYAAGNEAVIAGGAMIGGLMAYLIFNAYPAKVFMGDTGSLTIGGIIAVGAIIIHKELMLPILCGIFFVESLSVMMQVYYYKIGKRRGVKQRIFKRTPIHDNFRTQDSQLDPDCKYLWKKPRNCFHESKITVRFWIVTIILAALTIITLKIR